MNTSASARELESHAKFIVARRLLADPSVPIEAVRDYAVGTNWFYSCAGLAALCDRDDRDEALDTVTAFFDNLTPWGLHFGLSYLAATNPRPPVGVPLLSARDYWRDNMFVITAFREYLDKRASLGDEPDFGAGLDAATPEARETIKAVLARINHPLAGQLIETLEATRLTNIDRTFLSSFGRFWAGPQGAELLVEPEAWREALAAAESAVLQTPTRSLLVSGEHRVGKTSFLRLLAKRLGDAGLGRVRGRRRRPDGGPAMVRPARGPHPAHASRSWPPPRSSSGTSPTSCSWRAAARTRARRRASSTRSCPPSSSGRLIVWTEAIAAGTARLLQSAARRCAACSRSCASSRRSQEETAALAPSRACSAWPTRPTCTIEPGCVDGGAQLRAPVPERRRASRARCSTCIKLTRQPRRSRAGSARVDAHEVIVDAVAAHRPAGLDPRQQGARRSRRRSATTSPRRVIGQNEAVAAVVERIAMLKAGLNDPGKPIGVFLFAGSDRHRQDRARQDGWPNSVRLGRAHDPPRHERVPDAEIDRTRSSAAATPATTDSLDQPRAQAAVLGGAARRVREGARQHLGPVPAGVRRRPAHRRQLGHVADFRHCIIILTTNLGATSHRTSGLGFAPGGRRLLQRADPARHRPDLPPRVPEPARQGDRVPPADARPDARAS